QYFLLKEFSGGTAATAFTADITSNINLSGTGAKVALVGPDSAGLATSLGCNGSTGQPCNATQRARIIDLVGYDGANFFEGAAAAPSLNNATAAVRGSGGCTDSDVNSTDFSAAAPTPRNSLSPTKDCAPPTSLTISAASATPSTVPAGDSTTLSVSVLPGQHPTSQNIKVSVDLTSLDSSGSHDLAGD